MAKNSVEKKKLSWETVLSRLLSAPKTRLELKRRLAEKGCPADTADVLLDQYQELGMIDDRAYALLYIDSKCTCGIRRLRDELRYKGVSCDDIESALEESGIDERQRAIDYAMSVCKTGNMTEDKLMARLERRGFSYPSIRAAIELLKNELTRFADLLDTSGDDL